VPYIAGIPPGGEQEGKNYLEFLKVLKRKLGGRTLSIAAPASFWYLKQFPIEEIGKVVDYIVYMTYDLHGQWDAGNKWSNPGCPGGNCLRSHVNKTETLNALVSPILTSVELE
jgi:chitinase